MRDPTKSSINWDHVAEGWNWLATCKDGSSFFFLERPEIHFGTHFGTQGMPCVSAIGFSSFVVGTCDWKESVVVRPGFEEGQD